MSKNALANATPWLWNFIGGFLVLFVGLLIVSPLVGEPFGSYATAGGFSFLSVALALLVTEILLKDAFAKDLLSLTGLKRRFRDIGLEDLTNGSDNGWEKVTDESKELLLVLSRPTAWVDAQSDSLREVVEARAVAVTIALADPRQFDSVMTTIHDYGDISYARDTALAVERLEMLWNNSWNPNSGARLTIVYLDALVRAPIFSGDKWVELHFPAPVSEIGVKPLVAKLRGRSDSDVGRWIQNALRAVSSATQEVPLWESYSKKSTQSRAVSRGDQL